MYHTQHMHRGIVPPQFLMARAHNYLQTKTISEIMRKMRRVVFLPDRSPNSRERNPNETWQKRTTLWSEQFQMYILQSTCWTSKEHLLSVTLSKLSSESSV